MKRMLAIHETLEAQLPVCWVTGPGSPCIHTAYVACGPGTSCILGRRGNLLSWGPAKIGGSPLYLTPCYGRSRDPQPPSVLYCRCLIRACYGHILSDTSKRPQHDIGRHLGLYVTRDILRTNACSWTKSIRNLESLGLQMPHSTCCLYAFGTKVGIIHVLGAPDLLDAPGKTPARADGRSYGLA